MTLHALPLSRPRATAPPDSLRTVTILVEVTVGPDNLSTMQDVVDGFLKTLGRMSSVTVTPTTAFTSTAALSSTAAPATALAPAPVHAEPLATVRRLNSDRTIEIVPRLRTAHCGRTEVVLTRREFDLLLFFAQHPGRVFTRAQLLRNVWGFVDSGERTVDVHVTRLRRRFSGVGQLLRTVRGVGYLLDEGADVVVSDG